MQSPFFLLIHSLPETQCIEIEAIDATKGTLLLRFVFEQQVQEMIPAFFDALKKEGYNKEECFGVGLWQEGKRFTIERLAGVFVNALGWSMQIPVFFSDERRSFEQIYAEYKDQSYIPLVIPYSASPTIHPQGYADAKRV